MNALSQNSKNKRNNLGQVVFILFFIVLAIVYVALVKNCKAGYFHIIEPFGGTGQYIARMNPGRYLIKPFDRVHIWEKSKTFWFSADRKEGSTTDESVQVRFNDGGTAGISGSVRYIIGNNEEKFTQMHIEYRNERNFIDRAIKQIVTESLTLTATLMPAEESYTTRKAMFTQWALDQLNNGVYLVDIELDTTFSQDGGMKINTRSRIRRDKDNNIMRKDYSLSNFDVRFSQYVIQDPDYEKSIQNQIKAKLNNLMGKVASSAEAELASAQEARAKAQGQFKVVQAIYEQEVKNVVEIVNAQMDKDTSEIRASQRREVASIDRQASEWIKKANILEGQGKAEYKRLLQAADDNLDIRLDMWLAGHMARAQAIANGKDPAPEIILNQNASSGDRSLELLNLNAAKQLISGGSK